MTNESKGPRAPISLPKGGGAIKGIGETFQPNLFSGTGNFSIPISTSPGRNGFGPQLTVQYSTGNGNGPFGVGWQLSLPRINRKTEKGLPTYTKKDVFVMSGAEDLVPHLAQTSAHSERWEPLVSERGDFTISLYRPRTEGLFARIERWESKVDRDVHWRATTKDNVTSIYGHTATARITDPENSRRVYEWLLEETFDAKGNHMLYEYVQEDAAIELPGIHNHNRSYTQAYIRRIIYGNTPDNLAVDRRVGPIRMATDHANPLLTRERHYLFEVLFDYEEPFDSAITENLNIAADLSHDTEHTVTGDWLVRGDPFSSFRSGFEIRTLRRCRRVLMRHHFNEGELIGAPLVKSTDFQYTVNPDTQLSFLSSATVSGYRRDPVVSQQYLKRSLPPVTFKYSEFKPQEQRYQSVTAKGRDLPPRSLDAPDFTVMDVFGNALPDILQDTGGGFHHWENLGQGQLDRRHPQHGSQPVHSFAEANVSIGDMGGDGLADLVVDAPPVSGFYESTPDGQWKAFRRFETMPSFNLSDPNTRLLDLTGDGLSDVLVTRDSHFLWFRCKGETGYEEPLRISRKHDLDIFPDVYFNDPAGRVRLADMTGDGLNDIVLVHDGRIDYWPNMGYGKFGRRNTMANTPRIGYDYDPQRLFLADLDGSGSADLVYVEHCRVCFWFNQSGNGWSDEQTVDGTPNISDLTSVQFTDFYGTGTTTLLWSYDFGHHPGGSNYKILDFCGGKKPNLLVEMDNNMGATTRVQFAPSTRFYLEDKANGTPWHTNLPFPVQVLEKTEVIDHISKTKLVTSYKYHHGYYDGREREFRGFGRVDQFDTEFFDDFSGTSLHGDKATFDNHQKGFHVPPVETRTWFHTGVYFDETHYLDHREFTEKNHKEFYSGDPEAFQLEAHTFEQPDGSNAVGDMPHEAYRALRGAVLRTEVYGRDASEKSDHPYTVTETRYQVKALQPKDSNNHAVYLTTTNESLSYHYERNPADPRVSHSITLGIDGFGNVTDSVAIGYPRRVVPDELLEQGETRIVYSRTDFINPNSPPSADADFYYAGIPFQSRQYEVTGIIQPDLAPFSASQFLDIRDTTAIVDTDSFKPYESVSNLADTDEQRRIIEWTRSYFRTNAAPDLIDPIGSLDHRLPLGEIESLALPYETYQAAFTKGMLQQIYGERITGLDLPQEGGYHPHPDHALTEGDGGVEDYLWIPSGRQGFDSGKFLQANHTQDPFGNTATAETDVYALLVEAARDALPGPMANVIAAKNDYRVLQAFEMTDPNGNRSQVAFDALGLVVGTAAIGKKDSQGDPVGDTLKDFVPDLTDEVKDRHINDPLNLDASNDTNPHDILKGASTRLVYDLNRFVKTGEPNVVYTMARETHVSDEQGSPSEIQHAFVYSDGFGRESQSKVQAEPDNETPAIPRWVGTGTTIYNNKGKAVQQFEPFFSNDHRHGIEQHGVSPTLFYDPLERVICTVNPNHTYEKVLFDPWQQITWDSNDTVLLDPRTDDDVIEYVRDYFSQYDQEFEDAQGIQPQTWFVSNSSSNDTASLAAAEKTTPHANTPSIAHHDTLARPFLTIADNGLDAQGNEQKFPTRVVMDIEGNQRQVIDAKDRIVMLYDYNMLSAPIHQASMEAGQRWMLNDVTGQAIRAWDNRGHSYFTEYDPLRRPLRSVVTGADPENPAQKLLTERMIYGEQHPDAEMWNLRDSLYLHFETAGVVSVEAIDFKGNPLRASRRIVTEYKKAIDWSVVDAALPADATTPIDIGALEPVLSLLLEDDTYTSQTAYDALNRPIEITSPHTPTMQANIIHPAYNEGNLLESVEANLQDAAAVTAFVTNIDYDAKGQRQRIDYGSRDGNRNRVHTLYDYDPQTFRLIQMRTLRGAEALQNLQYTYDPVGNITNIRDDAQQTHYFNNAVVVPHAGYTYDALYRLIEATGREHLGQNRQPIPHNHDDALRTHLPHPGDPAAMGTYTEHYLYDAVGNFLKMQHRGNNPSNPGWVRTYNYQEPSQIESNKQNNRLSGTVIRATTETYSSNGDGYDTHGNMLRMPHLSVMQWNYRDQLQATARQVVNNGNPETTRYVYDASGERVRKLTEMANGRLKQERIYLGGFEIYRNYNTDGSVKLERETLHIMDDSQRIALVETRTQGNEPGLARQVTRYQFGNHLGSASLELDHEAKIISYEEYTPYGSTSYQAGRSQAEVKRKQYRYTGMERDEESGLSYHSARYYLPWLGRWGSADPAGLLDHINLYFFTKGNPVTFVDRSGRNTEKDAREAERALIAARREQAQLQIDLEKELTDLNEIDSNMKIREHRIEMMEWDLKHKQFEGKNAKKAKQKLKRKLRDSKVAQAEELKNFEAGTGRMENIHKKFENSRKNVAKHVKKVIKAKGDPTLEPGDIKNSEVIDDAAKEVDKFLDGVETEGLQTDDFLDDAWKEMEKEGFVSKDEVSSMKSHVSNTPHINPSRFLSVKTILKGLPIVGLFYQQATWDKDTGYSGSRLEDLVWGETVAQFWEIPMAVAAIGALLGEGMAADAKISVKDAFGPGIHEYYKPAGGRFWPQY